MYAQQKEEEGTAQCAYDVSCSVTPARPALSAALLPRSAFSYRRRAVMS